MSLIQNQKKIINENSASDLVTPGDFGSLAGKIRFMEPSEISSEIIIDDLCKIQEEKNNENSKRIGFAC